MNLTDYDGAEMRYCVELIDAGENHYVESFGDEAEAGSDEQFTDRVCNRFWSVYLHYDPAGSNSKTGVECIADCPLKEYAELIAESVDRRVRSKEVVTGHASKVQTPETETLACKERKRPVNIDLMETGDEV